MQENTGHSFSAYFKRAVSPLIVLALLRDRKMYGYEISQEINLRTHKKRSIAVLYPVLYRLEEQGYIRIENQYVLDCELKKISFEYRVREYPLRCLEDLDLVAILGNLMDNAITAASESEKKWVSLTTSVRNTYNVVVIKNSCDVPPQAQGERLHSASLKA